MRLGLRVASTAARRACSRSVPRSGGTGGPGRGPSRVSAGPGSESPGNWGVFGSYLRTQRKLAQLSLRQLAELTRVSNPYLSQIERGLHQPSVAVIKSLARALNLSVEDLLAQAAGVDDEVSAPSTEVAIRLDPRLTVGQKGALLAVYHSMLDEAGAGSRGGPVPSTGSGGTGADGSRTADTDPDTDRDTDRDPDPGEGSGGRAGTG